MTWWQHFKQRLALAFSSAPPRSPHWPLVRKQHLVKEPVCRACGGSRRLQVHHIRPFHLRPELELDPANLITLCEKPSHNCHFVHGHALNWRGWNTQVCEDVTRFRQRVEESQRLAQDLNTKEQQGVV